jgi:hypothetical protein
MNAPERDDQPFPRIALSSLRQKRRGKHHELVGKVIKELKSAADATAIQVPLSRLKGVSAPDFRSAISRAASAEGLKISTYSDAVNFYVWVRSSKTREYERGRFHKAQGRHQKS